MTEIKFTKGRFVIFEEKAGEERRFVLKDGDSVIAVLTPQDVVDLFNVARRMNLYLAIDVVAPDFRRTSENLG